MSNQNDLELVAKSLIKLNSIKAEKDLTYTKSESDNKFAAKEDLVLSSETKESLEKIIAVE